MAKLATILLGGVSLFAAWYLCCLARRWTRHFAKRARNLAAYSGGGFERAVSNQCDKLVSAVPPSKCPSCADLMMWIVLSEASRDLAAHEACSEHTRQFYVLRCPKQICMYEEWYTQSELEVYIAAMRGGGD